jgi:hypothetical protein
VAIWWSSPHSQDHIEGNTAHAGVQQVRAKLLAVRLPRTVLAVYGGHAWGDRFVFGEGTFPSYQRDTLQNDRIWSWDFALPAEFLIGRRSASARPSLFFGPRLAYARYDDRLRPDGTFSVLLPGAVSGFHISAYQYEFFFESSLAYVPRHAFQGSSSGGRVSVMPALGLVVRVGPPYLWGRGRR